MFTQGVQTIQLGTQGVQTIQTEGPHVGQLGADLTLDLPLDARCIVLREGGKLRLVLSDMSLGSVHRLPWVHPITSKFTATTWVGGSDSVHLTVPTTDVNSLQVADMNRLREGYWRW